MDWTESLTLINAIESVQKQFTKRLPGLQNLDYSERLKFLGLQSLEHRRLKFNLILCYNIIHGQSAIPLDKMFILNRNTTLRGHSLKISLPLPKNNTSKTFFAYRVITPWNSLQSDVVMATTTNKFKTLLNKADLSKFLIFPST